MTPKELVEYVARSLADRPDAIVVKESAGEAATVLELRVARSDIGRIIGREGRNAGALRTLLGVMGARDGRRITLDIQEA
jgi:hypothetical protein